MINDIQDIDKNFAIEKRVEEPDIKYYNVRTAPFKIYGLYDPQGDGGFKRLPDDVGHNVNHGVVRMYKNTAGGRVRFCTDSKYIAIRAKMSDVRLMTHMPLLSSAGFDLYENTPDGSESYFRGSFKPPKDMPDGYEGEVKLPYERKLRYFTINFPSYSGVDELWIGIQEDAYLGEGAPYKNNLPVVYYGSSITQGGCSSRPGNSYQNLVSAKLSLDYINLGFSGNCRGESTIAEYMAGLPMCAFVCDYDHNAPNVEHLRATHLPLYKTIRKKNPTLPYIMISRPDFTANYEDSVARRDVIFDTYRYAREQGDKNVYFIDGEGIFRGEFEDACTVDGTHPNDLGFALMANTVACVLKRIMIADRNFGL